MHEHLKEVRELVEHRHAQTLHAKLRIIEFRHTNSGLETLRHSGFQPGMQNEVWVDGQMVMYSTDLPLRTAVRVRKVLSLSPSIDVTRGTYFYLPPHSIVPCHKDEEAHEGFQRGQQMLTFNVSSPKALLYVNSSGQESEVQFGVSGFFSTTLCPTKIYHGVVNGPEALFLLQFPIHS